MLPRAKVGAENHHSGWHLSAVHWGGQGGGKPGHLQVLCADLFVPVCVCFFLGGVTHVSYIQMGSCVNCVFWLMLFNLCSLP